MLLFDGTLTQNGEFVQKSDSGLAGAISKYVGGGRVLQVWFEGVFLRSRHLAVELELADHRAPLNDVDGPRRHNGCEDRGGEGRECLAA